MTKQRRVMQVAPTFSEKLKKLQKKLMMKGDLRSIRDLTDAIARSSLFEEIEGWMSVDMQNMNLDPHGDTTGFDTRRRK